MEELKVIQTQGKIECNFDEIREALKVQMSAYTGVKVEEETLSDYKKQLATLRKIRKAVDGKRLEIEREFTKPLEEFKAEVKTLTAEIDKPINDIDSQIKQFEKNRKEKKRQHIKEVYEANIGELAEFLPLEKIYDEKWENVSAKDTDIAYDISAHRLKVTNDLNVIKALNSEIEDELIDCYQRSGNDLSKAIQRNSQFIEDREHTRQRLEEEARRKAEEEARRKAEEEARRADEEARKEAETKVESEENKAETKGDNLKSLDNFVQMTKIVKIIISVDDLKPVKETLDFMGVNYSVEE